MADMLANYPVQWIDRWQLADGQWVTVRPVLPQDHLIERAFVAQGMTARSRYQRFQIGLRELSDSVARYLTEVDYERHFALVVEHFGPGGHVQIADARFVRDPRRSTASEFALAVADDWQGLGLGRRLLQTLLAAARAQGQQTLYGDVLRDNQPMLALARAAGFSRQSHPDDARLLRVQRAVEDTGGISVPRTPRPAGLRGADPRRHPTPAAGW